MRLQIYKFLIETYSILYFRIVAVPALLHAPCPPASRDPMLSRLAGPHALPPRGTPCPLASRDPMLSRLAGPHALCPMLHAPCSMLFAELGPGVLQAHGAVEYQPAGLAVIVEAEISESLKLEFISLPGFRKRRLYLAPGEDTQ